MQARRLKGLLLWAEIGCIAVLIIAFVFLPFATALRLILLGAIVAIPYTLLLFALRTGRLQQEACTMISLACVLVPAWTFVNPLVGNFYLLKHLVYFSAIIGFASAIMIIGTQFFPRLFNQGVKKDPKD